MPQIHTGEREEGEVEASCKIGSTHAISTTSSRPWAVGLKMAFVRGGSGSPGDMAVLPSSRPAAGKCASTTLTVSHPCPLKEAIAEPFARVPRVFCYVVLPADAG